MNFGIDHYVPVLKVKRGEKKALQLIDPAVRAQVVPLLEIVERRQDQKGSVSAHLDTAFKELADSIRPYPGCFLDVREIASDGPSGAEEAFGRAADAGIVFTPVTGISRIADVRPALDHSEQGLAIRLTRDEFEEGGLARQLRDFTSRHGLAPEATDLIVDLGPVEEMIAQGVANFATQFLLEVPEPQAWRTLTASASAFPRSMGIVNRKSHAFVERAEWLAWRNDIRGQSDRLPRVPTYSDCAIQHPIGVEGFDPVRMQVSASVRYALPERWLLIKGESTRRRLPSIQFPELATQLVYGHLRAHYAGEDHCRGCASIKAAADGQGGFGSAEAWRRIGTAHHITVVTEALKAMSGL